LANAEADPQSSQEDYSNISSRQENYRRDCDDFFSDFFDERTARFTDALPVVMKTFSVWKRDESFYANPTLYGGLQFDGNE